LDNAAEALDRWQAQSPEGADEARRLAQAIDLNVECGDECGRLAIRAIEFLLSGALG